MSPEVPVQFLRNYGPYLRGDMAAVPAEEVSRLLAAGMVVLVGAREVPIETATVTPPERAVTRRGTRR